MLGIKNSSACSKYMIGTILMKLTLLHVKYVYGAKYEHVERLCICLHRKVMGNN